MARPRACLCRPSTTLPRPTPPIVDGRAKPGHDTMRTTVPYPACLADASSSRPGTRPDHHGASGRLDQAAVLRNRTGVARPGLCLAEQRDAEVAAHGQGAVAVQGQLHPVDAAV